MTTHTTDTREQWLAARLELLDAERIHRWAKAATGYGWDQ